MSVKIMETYKIETEGGTSQVIYTSPWWGLGSVIKKNQEDYLFNYFIQEYTAELLIKYAGMQKIPVAITISNRAKAGVNDPLSYWQYLYNKLVKESNYNPKDPKASVGYYYLISQSVEKFKELSGLTTAKIESVAKNFIASMLPENADGTTTTPTAEELRDRAETKMKLDLSSEKETLNPNNNKMVQVPGVGGINQNYLIIGVLAVVGYFIWKKNK